MFKGYKMNELELKYRMYGLVPYNISEIQKGIQFGHAVVEYSNKYQNNKIYEKWAKNDKTFIILNGGTTNNIKESEWYGTLNQHRDTLLIHPSIKFAEFREPDLGNQLTAVVFLVDERVFDKELYPDFVDYAYEKYGSTSKDKVKPGPRETFIERMKQAYPADFNEWVKFIGGAKNLFLREFLSQFKLA